MDGSIWETSVTPSLKALPFENGDKAKSTAAFNRKCNNRKFSGRSFPALNEHILHI